MSLPKQRTGFLKRLAENLEQVDKQTLLSRLVSESELHQNWLELLDRLDEGVLIVSTDGEINFINSAATRLLGVPSDAEKPFWKHLIDSDLRHFFQNQFKSLSSEVTQTLRVLNPKERDLKIHIHPQLFKTPTRHLVSLIDLTDPILPEVERLARNRFESIIRLAGGLAHEIGNPLNAISLHSSILKKQIEKSSIHLNEKLTETVEIIQDEIRRLDHIVRSFLKTTRRAPLRFRMMNLCAIITDVLKVLRPSLEEHDIQLNLDMPDKVEFFLDEERIRSMLTNLIQNSLEAMLDGGKLLIAVRLQGQAVQIIIQDSGKSIAKEDLPHIFEAYFTTKDHGSGLGLLFVYDAVTDHGGKIQVDSKKGKGTRFEILLPLRRSNLQINHTLSQEKEGTENA